MTHSEVCAAHAGSWRGGTVAVKVLCHAGSRAAKLNALHESVVCAHVQHPNVVWAKASCMQAHASLCSPSVAKVVLSVVKRLLDVGDAAP